MKANDRLTYMTPELVCLEKINRKGFSFRFQMEGPSLLCIENKRAYQPEEISVINFYRFEGVSNPDDMSIIYAIETGDGTKGTLIDAYGMYADTNVGEFMNMVKNFEKQTSRGWV